MCDGVRLSTDLELDDPWWDERGYMTDEVKVGVPALHINSWRLPVCAARATGKGLTSRC